MTRDAKDRRIKKRYPAAGLKVQMRERGFFGRSKAPMAVTCLDLNRYGMAILSPRPTEPGARVHLDFEGKYISASRVCAKVVRCQRFQTGYRLSLQFSYCLEQKSYSREVDNALSRIEAFYNRFAS